MEEEEKNEEYINYRINTHTKYTVYKTSYAGRDFYKIYFEKKNKDGSKTRIYRSIKFVNCVPPEDRDVIRIMRAFEDNYIDPKNKYNDVCILVIQEYEPFKNEDRMKEEAYENFHRTMEETDDLTDENLPF